ncbi:1,2-dihydroxy-3-keto-5-methylthiopentene dioxygenase [Elsinoe australis]|uniref:1,2-dihydroxy-3-keto-5-methylthiopentene dioxygenase n=1 Tax=Elsinoe australis TaxID=40998 RepID=A0A2P7YJP5_9PEZI|nr:1,2-dihydroxy-3-keto-5-methylthiopentene dioxygenase [Elsinoe australis]
MSTPLSQLRVSKHFIPAWKLTPNTSIINKPLLVYHKAFSSANASALEAYFSKIGVVTPQWRYTMYSTSHFHSTTHEVLGISSGSAKLCFGHEDNPERVVEKLTAGDVVVIPAGVAHRLLEDIEGGFEMVGCYPKGHNWDMCYGKEGEEDKVKGISKVDWFTKDPVYGDKGPVLDV